MHRKKRVPRSTSENHLLIQLFNLSTTFLVDFPVIFSILFCTFTVFLCFLLLVRADHDTTCGPFGGAGVSEFLFGGNKNVWYPSILAHDR